MELTLAIDDVKLLDHPFYRRWEEGALREGELAAYAAQYRHFEAQLPGFLEALAAMVPDASRGLIEANLADEVEGPVSHLELFERFAAAVDAPSAAPSPAMARLVAVYADALSAGDADVALGVLAGYEIQAAEVAETKGEGLSRHYGVGAEGRSFWDVHAGIEADHAAGVIAATASSDPEQLMVGVRASAEAWWSFLDEREALAAA